MRAANSSALRTVSIRPQMVFGPGDPLVSDDMLLSDVLPPTVGNEQRTHTPIYVKNLAALLVRAAAELPADDGPTTSAVAADNDRHLPRLRGGEILNAGDAHVPSSEIRALLLSCRAAPPRRPLHGLLPERIPLAIAWLLSRQRARHFWAYVFITLILGLSFAVAYLGSDGTEHSPLISSILGFYSPFSRAWEFAVGALIALIGANWRRLGRAGGTIAAVLGTIAVLASFWRISSATPFPGPWTLLPVLGTGLLIIGGLASNTLISRVLASRPLLWVGDRSYSI